jgi:hypothetical protein
MDLKKIYVGRKTYDKMGLSTWSVYLYLYPRVLKASKKEGQSKKFEVKNDNIKI